MTPLEWILLIIVIALIIGLLLWFALKSNASSEHFIDSGIDITTNIDLSDIWSGDGGSFSGGGSSGSWDISDD